MMLLRIKCSLKQSLNIWLKIKTLSRLEKTSKARAELGIERCSNFQGKIMLRMKILILTQELKAWWTIDNQRRRILEHLQVISRTLLSETWMDPKTLMKSQRSKSRCQESTRSLTSHRTSAFSRTLSQKPTTVLRCTKKSTLRSMTVYPTCLGATCVPRRTLTRLSSKSLRPSKRAPQKSVPSTQRARASNRSLMSSRWLIVWRCFSSLCFSASGSLLVTFWDMIPWKSSLTGSLALPFSSYS